MTVTSGSAQAHPYWQDRPCPSWCEYQVAHQYRESPGEHLHLGPEVTMTLTMDEPPASHLPGGPEMDPPQLSVFLLQQDREREPRMAISYDHNPALTFTLTEARQLAGNLAALIRQAESAAGPGLRNGHERA